MTRLVQKTATGPHEIKKDNGSAWICMCGLSSNQPFCDGSHNRLKVIEEAKDKTYTYDKHGQRHSIDDDTLNRLNIN